jgi:2-oxoisovalerate dehydrogenase E1 component beta subunit
MCGIKTVVPSNPRDARLLIAAIGPDPVVPEPKRLPCGPFDGHYDRPVTPGQATNWVRFEGHYAISG